MPQLIAAVLVLKQIWVRVPVTCEDGADLLHDPPVFHGRPAWLSRRVVIPPRAVLALLGLMLLGAVIAVRLNGDSQARYAVVVLGTLTGVGALLAWLAGI